MKWNYRLFKQDAPDTVPDVGDPVFFVGECYYDEDGKPQMCSGMDHNIVCGNTPEETKEVYEMIGEAFNAPVIELDSEGNFKEK